VHTQFPLLNRLASPRHASRAFLLVAGTIVLGAEFILLLPSVLQRWNPFDYGLYVEMGNAVRQGVNPYGFHHYWPLPTMLWIFVPLSLMPDWFRLVWIIGPIISVLILFRTRGVLLFLFTPIWFVIGDGMLDGWLLIPLAWLLENRPIWAGVGAALVLFKPQLAILAVVYTLLKWLVSRDWKNLAVFVGLMLLFYVPSFILRPAWPLEMMAVLPGRAAQTTTLFPLMTGSIWVWWAIGGLGVLVLVALLLAIGVLMARVVREETTRASGFVLLNLLLNPLLFASNHVMALPTLRSHNGIFVIVFVSLVAFFLDHAFAGFNAYAGIPFVALYFLAQRTNRTAQKEIG
jgi:hypothetical protein